MRIYYKIGVFVCFSKKNFVVYHDLDHDLDHDKQQSFLRETHKYLNFVINTHYYYFVRRLFCRKKTPEGTPQG